MTNEASKPLGLVNDTIMHCRAMAGYSYLSTYRLMYSVYPKLHQNGLLIVQLTI